MRDDFFYFTQKTFFLFWKIFWPNFDSKRSKEYNGSLQWFLKLSYLKTTFEVKISLSDGEKKSVHLVWNSLKMVHEGCRFTELPGFP